MPLPQQWIDALTGEHQIEVSSTDALVTAVTAKRVARIARFPPGNAPPMKPLANVRLFDPPLRATLKLNDLLLAIGEITTPPVPNFSDISSTWAILRYAWAFDSFGGAVGRLQLS